MVSSDTPYIQLSNSKLLLQKHELSKARLRPLCIFFQYVKNKKQQSQKKDGTLFDTKDQASKCDKV